MSYRVTSGDVGVLRGMREDVRRLTQPQAAGPNLLGPGAQLPLPMGALAMPGSPDTKSEWTWTQAVLGTTSGMSSGSAAAGSTSCGLARDLAGAALVVYGPDLAGRIQGVLLRLYVDFWAVLGGRVFDASSTQSRYSWTACSGQGFDGLAGTTASGWAVNVNSAPAATGTIVRVHQRGAGTAEDLGRWEFAGPAMPAVSNPLDLTYTGSHYLTADRAYDAAFDVRGLWTQSTYDGVKVSRTVGFAYDATNAIFYEYRRDETLNLLGQMVSAAAVVRVETVALVNCTAGGT